MVCTVVSFTERVGGLALLGTNDKVFQLQDASRALNTRLKPIHIYVSLIYYRWNRIVEYVNNSSGAGLDLILSIIQWRDGCGFDCESEEWLLFINILFFSLWFQGLKISPNLNTLDLPCLTCYLRDTAWSCQIYKTHFIKKLSHISWEQNKVQYKIMFKA